MTTGCSSHTSAAASPFGPGRLRAHAFVAPLAQAASLGCGPRLGLHPDAPRRGRDQFIHSF
jgi:hypothetical protein